MRITRLSLENIGPFREAELEFKDVEGRPSQVVLITGENGTGKTIILDAIRGMFGSNFARLERDIRRQGTEVPQIAMTMEIGAEETTFSTVEFRGDYIVPSPGNLELTRRSVQDTGSAPDWIVDYWPASVSASGSYQVNQMTAPDHRGFLNQALQGKRAKSDITQLICHFDYLRDSRDPDEQATGEQVYETLKGIIAESLLDGGYLSHVARATYEPIIVQNEQAVPLANLSGGNVYLIHNLVSALGKMYSVHFLNKTPPSEMCQTPGLLLIDEAENQLHPKWQKNLIGSILKFFPNVQIVATTHSPFIVASVRGAQIFVCKARVDHCVIEDETAEYSNKPVDEILMSPLFEGTRPFSAGITALLDERDKAIRAGDTQRRADLERQLLEINPTYFGFFDIEQMLDELDTAEDSE